MVSISQEQAVALAERIIRRKVVALPVLEVPDIYIGDTAGDEETMVLLLSDVHFGHKTPTTTCRVIANRMERLAQRVVKIAEIHRKAYPVRKIVVFMLGDFCQGDQIGRFVSLDELENTVMVQVFDWAVPHTARLLLTLQEHFEEVEVYAVRGNHGSVRRYGAEDTNWDTIIYDAVKLQLAQQPRITINVERDRFYMLPKVYKFTFLIQHGDNIRSYLNIPFYGQIRMANRMRGAIPGRFHYVVYAHFHTSAVYNWNDITVLLNGCFVSDDQWVLKRMGMSSDTSQLLVGVHPRKGLTWRYKIHLD